MIDESLGRLKEFVYENIGSRVDYDIIEKRFMENTIGFFVKEILRTTREGE